MTEIAFISIATLTHTLKFVTRFDFAFIMRMGTVVRKPTFTMDELFADTIRGQLIVISRSWLLDLVVRRHVIGGIVVAVLRRIGLFGVH